MRGVLRAVALSCAIFVGACSSAEQHLLLFGSGPDLDKSKISSYAANQTEILKSISVMAGFEGAQPSTPPQWKVFVLAGMNFADVQCTEYLVALDKFYRAKNTTKQQIALNGAATAGILGLVGATAQAIAITAIAFGLASATVENVSSGLVFDLPAPAVIQLVRDMQQSYRAGIPPAGYSDRASAFTAIQGYVNLCLPASIETQIANAVQIAKPEMKAGNAEQGLPPIVQIGPIKTLSYGPDSNSALLKAYLLKADKKTLDPEKSAAIQDAMNKVGITGIHVMDVVFGAPYAAERAAIVKELRL